MPCSSLVLFRLAPCCSDLRSYAFPCVPLASGIPSAAALCFAVLLTSSLLVLLSSILCCPLAVALLGIAFHWPAVPCVFLFPVPRPSRGRFLATCVRCFPVPFSRVLFRSPGVALVGSYLLLASVFVSSFRAALLLSSLYVP